MTEQEIVRLLSTIKMKVKSTVADETWGKALQLIEQLQVENAALRSATQYLIDDGGADCCAKCIYCPQPTEEDDDCLCHHGGDCVDGVTKWFMQNG